MNYSENYWITLGDVLRLSEAEQLELRERLILESKKAVELLNNIFEADND